MAQASSLPPKSVKVDPGAFPTQRERLDHDSVVVLRGGAWADYQRLLQLRGERSLPRITYLEGAIELMIPSRSHQGIKSMIGRLVEAWCLETGVDITPYGSWTLEHKELDRGVEPDECYVLGDDTDPQYPDLAIEVEWTSGRLDKLDVYCQIGVREVWCWRQGELTLHALRGEQYVPIEHSEVLLGIDARQLLAFVDTTPMTKAVRAYREALSEL